MSILSVIMKIIRHSYKVMSVFISAYISVKMYYNILGKTNYRLANLLTSFSKLLENIMYDKIMNS